MTDELDKSKPDETLSESFSPPGELPSSPPEQAIPNGGLPFPDESFPVTPASQVEYNEEMEQDKGMRAVADTPEEEIEAPGLPKADVPIPPAESTTGAPMFSEAAFLPPSPTAGMPGSQTPRQKKARPADPKMVDLFITQKRLEELWNDADHSIEELNQRIHTLPIARTLLDQIQYARNELLAGKDHYEEAERYLNEVRYRVNQNYQARRWSYSVGVPIFLYELIWAIFLIWVVLGFLEGDALTGGNTISLTYLVGCMAWGGLGGVVGAWLALVKHIAQDQDFDKQHTMWYLNSPLMGLGVGAFIYLIMGAGLLSLTGGANQPISSPLVIYVLAWLAGYQHNIFTDIVKRLLKVFEIQPKTLKEEKVSSREDQISASQPLEPAYTEETPSKQG
jgi:hypothetical protein